MTRQTRLTVIGGPSKGCVFDFDAHDTLLCGRMSDCHCRLPDDPQVSRHHFIVEANPPDARIRDFGSLNGTWVNGKRIGAREKGESPEEGQKRKYPDVALADGDEIRVGDCVLKVSIEGAVPDASPILCGRCGKNVRDEVGSWRGGDYICLECRKSIASDPVAQLAKMLAPKKPETPEAKGLPRIDGYTIRQKLGEGGFGAVYLGEEEKTGRKVAIKVMLSRVAVEPEAREKFQHEIEAMRALTHPNLVTLLRHGGAGSGFYFVMELCEAGSVGALMKRRGGKVDLAEAGPLMLQVLEGLAFVHKHGFVHRDLKPENILLQGNRERRIAKIADLGFAKNFEQAGFSGMTVTGSFAGTPVFMPREQLTNYKYVKPESDVWSMAATFYVMLTGSLPREVPKGMDPIEGVLHGRIVPIRERMQSLPVALASAFDQALAVNAKDRFGDGGEMLAAWRKALS